MIVKKVPFLPPEMMNPQQNCTDRESLKRRILAYPRWYHSFQLDATTRITGWAERVQAYPKSAFAENGFRYYHLPSHWRDKTVLDIGGWDGALSFEMERRGSKEVVLVNPRTLDDLDLPLVGPGSRESVEQKYLEEGFPLDFVHSGGARLLRDWFDSKVRIVDSSVYDLSAKLDNEFDLVLFLGLLYHLRDPVLGLEVASSLTRELLILETMCFSKYDPLAHVGRCLCEFVGGDVGPKWLGWWRFNDSAIKQMLRACNFQQTEKKGTWGRRCVYHAYKSAR